MLDTITSINSAINNVVWGWPALILLSFAGILMTCLTKFLQVTHIGHWMKETIDEQLRRHIYYNPEIEQLLADREAAVLANKQSSFTAARDVLDHYFAKFKTSK